MSDKLTAERLREFIAQAERADNIVVADERFRAERFLWNNRAAILAMAEERDRMREALERAGTRFDMLAPALVEGNSLFAVKRWANEARYAALGKDQAS